MNQINEMVMALLIIAAFVLMYIAICTGSVVMCAMVVFDAIALGVMTLIINNNDN